MNAASTVMTDTTVVGPEHLPWATTSPEALTTEDADRITDAFTDLFAALPEFAPVLDLVTVRALPGDARDDDVTAQPDPEYVGTARMSPRGVMSLNTRTTATHTRAERAGLFLHEILHLLNLEMRAQMERGYRNHAVSVGWNLCADTSINAIIRDLVPRGITDAVTCHEDSLSIVDLEGFLDSNGVSSDLPAWDTPGGYFDRMQQDAARALGHAVPTLEPLTPEADLASRLAEVETVAVAIKQAIADNPCYEGSLLARWARN